MKNRVTDIIIGCLIGLIATTIGTVIHLVYLSYKEGMEISEILKYARQYGGLGAIVAIGAAMNLVAFFTLLRSNKDVIAKGVLIITFIMAIILMMYKMF